MSAIMRRLDSALTESQLLALYGAGALAALGAFAALVLA